MAARLRILHLLILIGFLTVWCRLIYIQIINHSQYSRMALIQYQNLSKLLPKRGQILALGGETLAVSITTSSAQKYIRIYPDSSQSAFLTGIVGKDIDGQDIGYFGLEGYYDRQLRGRIGQINQETDVFNRPILIGKSDILPSQEGSDLYTSIDVSLQYFASKFLQEGLEKYQAVGGTVTIMDSPTGHILAMVSMPSYDPNHYSDFINENFKNPIISSAYEPGSTFKPLVMAAALDSKAVSLDDICEVCSGPYPIGEYTIRSWNEHYYPHSTLFDIILHSDNVGMTYVSKRLGKSKLISYLKNLNLGQKTGIDLQEESSPYLRPESDWHDIDLATASFGQGLALTRLQMVSAINTLANRGIYVPPSIVTRIKSPLGIEKTDPVKSHRVYSAQAAETVVSMMVNGVEKGEVRYYKPAGYSIAGKTGTAQVPIAGHYDSNKVISSFVGFAPADRPRFTMLVTLDNPQSSPWGSTTAAPLWFKIASQIFKYYRMPPSS